MKNELTNAWQIARYLYNKNILLEIPEIKEGVHNGRNVYRVYYRSGKKYKSHECAKDSPKAARFAELKEKRDKAKRIVMDFEANLSAREKQQISRIKLIPYKAELNGRFFKELKECSNPVPFKGFLNHGNIRMRSRGEVIIAECLESLGLKYKYEPAVYINGDVYYPDFVVYLDFIDRCFLIEFLGMADNEEYMINALHKINKYFSCNILPGESLLTLYGTASYMPGTDLITAVITSLVNSLCCKALDESGLSA